MTLLKIAGALAYLAIVWWLAEYRGATDAIMAVAAGSVVAMLNIETAIAEIRNALKIHSKRLFPEHWSDD